MAFRMLGQSPTTPAARVRALRHRLAPHPSSVPSTQRVVSLYEALVARLPDKRKSFPDLDLPPLSAPSSDHHSGGQGDDWANIGSSSQPKKVCNAGGGPGDTEVVMLGGSEMSLLAEIEAALPLEVSRAARQRVLVKLSMDEVRREAEAKQKAKAEKKQQSSKGGWFSGWGKSKSSAQDKDRDEVKRLFEVSLSVYYSSNRIRNERFCFWIRFSCSTTIFLTRGPFSNASFFIAHRNHSG